MICDLCPRMCKAERTETAGKGVCRMPSLPVVARAALHQWEEPCISGTRGSGTVFFSGCSLGCVFCQNGVISHENFGKIITPERLREIFYELIEKGAHNINLVNPTHFSHVLEEVLTEPLPVPVVWNSGGYDRVETLQKMEGKVQIYLPDLKYRDKELAARYSRAADYPEVAAEAIREMVRQVGKPVFDSEGILQRGVVIRHLMLPGALSDTKAVMDFVAENFAPGEVLFSLMAQYTPQPGAEGMLSRRVTGSAYKAARAYMENVGIVNGYVQDTASAKQEYTPNFDLTGVESE